VKMVSFILSGLSAAALLFGLAQVTPVKTAGCQHT
jgi:hypothetical protein